MIECPDGNSMVQIYNVLGQLVFQQKLTSNVFDRQMETGVYIVELKGNGNSYRPKIVIN